MTKPFNNGYIRQNLTLVSVNVHICPLKISNFDSSNYYVISGNYSYCKLNTSQARASFSPRYSLQSVVTLHIHSHFPRFSKPTPAPSPPSPWLAAWEQQLQLRAFCSWNGARKPFEGVLKMKTSGSWQACSFSAKDKLQASGESQLKVTPQVGAQSDGAGALKSHTLRVGIWKSLVPWGWGQLSPEAGFYQVTIPFKGRERKLRKWTGPQPARSPGW